MAARCARGAWSEIRCVMSPGYDRNQGCPDCTRNHGCSITTSVSWCLQNIKAPLNGDDAAIRKYAQEMEALRKKVRSSSSLHTDELQTRTRPEPQHVPLIIAFQSDGTSAWHLMHVKYAMR